MRFLGLMVELTMTSEAKEFEDQEKEIENAAAAERERRKELGMDFDKAHGHLARFACQQGPCYPRYLTLIWLMKFQFLSIPDWLAG